MTDTENNKHHEEYLAELPEHIKVVRNIGSGGSGSVFLALDSRLNRKIAVKIIPARFPSSQDQAVKEARLLARINHPNVVQVYDVITMSQCIAIIMEYVDGRSLADCNRQSLLSLEDKLSILLAIAKGVEAAHREGVIHQDLTLANVLVTDDQQIKITDFGLSSFIAEPVIEEHKQQHKAHQQIIGTPGSIAPELFRGKPASAQSDMFAFGVIGWELLFGIHPWGPANAVTRNQRVIDDQRVAPPASNSAPDGTLPLMEALLSQQPEDRPESAAVLTEHLIQLQQQYSLSLPTQPVDPVFYQQGEKPTQRKWFFIIPLLIFISGVAGWYMSLADQPAENTVSTTADEEKTSTVAPRFIYVLPINTNGDVSRKLQDQPLILAAIKDAIQQAVISAPSLKLIDHQRDATSHLQQLSLETGATDFIRTRLNCTRKRCIIVMQRLNADDDTIIAQKQWPLVEEELKSVNFLAQSNIYQLFPTEVDQEIGSLDVSEQDYLQYLALYEAIQIKGDYDATVLNQLLKLLNQSPMLYPGYTLFREASLNMYSHTQDKQYLDNLKQVLSFAPQRYKNTASFQFDQLWLNMTAGNVEQTEQWFKELEKRDMTGAVVHELKGYFYREVTGDYQASVHEYRQALDYRQSNGILHNLALSYWWSGDNEKAISTLETLLAKSPGYYTGNQLLSALYLMTGHLKKAEALFVRMVGDGEKAHSVDISNLSLVLLLQRDMNQAEYYAEMALNKSPEHSGWTLNLADIYALKGKTSQANTLYQQVIASNQARHDVKSLLELAQAYAHLGQQSAAIKTINQAIRQAPDNNEVAYTASLVYTELEQYLSAVAQAEQAIALNMGVVWFELAWFDKLCQQAEFDQLMTLQNNAKRCEGI